MTQPTDWLDDTIAESTPLQSKPQLALLAGLSLGVVLIVLAIHWPVLKAQALSFDDAQFLTDNPLVQNPSWTSVRRFMGEVFEPSTVGGYYMPLSMISLMLDTAAGGSPSNLMPFHRTSLLLHGLNTALIILLIYQLFGRAWIAAAVGLLFGVHPMTVEPIAWVGERKTLLAAFFAFLSLMAYVRYAMAMGQEGERAKQLSTQHLELVTRLWYILSVICFLLSLMSKPTSTPLPLVLLLMDYWPLRRLSWRSVTEKVPFFIVAGISMVITLISHARTADVALPGNTSVMRIPLTICHLIVFYFNKILWPANLSSLYPLPEPVTLSNGTVLIGIVGTIILAAVLVYSLRWTRAFLTGWLMFFLAISPTLGVIGYSWITASDKYVYLPAVGLLFIVAWYIERLSQMSVSNILRCVVFFVLIGLEAVGTRSYLWQWQTTERLARHMVDMAPTSAEAHFYLSKALCDNGKLEEGIAHGRQAVKIKPDDLKTQIGLGNALLMVGRDDEAISHYRAAVELKPNYVPAQFNLGRVLARRGLYNEAVEHFQLAIQFRPSYTKAYVNLASALGKLGRWKESAEQWQRAKQLDPFEPYIRYQLGGVLLRIGQGAEGVKEFREANRLSPNDPEVFNQFAEALADLGRIDDAIIQCEAALKVKADYAPAHSSLGALWLAKGNMQEALSHVEKAVQISPNFVEGHINLAVVLAKQGQIDRALGEFKEALRIEPRNTAARINLGIMLQEQGKTVEAAEQFREVLKIDPLNREALRRLQAVETGKASVPSS